MKTIACAILIFPIHINHDSGRIITYQELNKKMVDKQYEIKQPEIISKRIPGATMHGK